MADIKSRSKIDAELSFGALLRSWPRRHFFTWNADQPKWQGTWQLTPSTLVAPNPKRSTKDWLGAEQALLWRWHNASYATDKALWQRTAQAVVAMQISALAQRARQFVDQKFRVSSWHRHG